MRVSTFVSIGASNHSKYERQAEDYYATDPIAAKLLLDVEPQLNNIWECACGEGHLAKVFENADKLGKATDLINRGYGKVEDFLLNYEPYHNGDIVTNPPYKYAQKFIEHALNKVDEGRYVCMFLKVLFLESQSRKEFFEKYPPKVIYVSSSRINCAKNGDFVTYNSGAVAYAWFVWLKGYNGETIVKWIN
ncbi:NAD(P)-dependent oxidoreductase [bacterium]|nr:NAD(P)-dependent oxidoreductase [bacterium]